MIFPRVPKLEKDGIKTPYTDVIKWFNKNSLELNYGDTDEDFYIKLNNITPLNDIVEEYAENFSDEDKDFSKELILWALTLNKKLDKSENESAFTFDSTGIGKYYSN